MVSFLHTPCCFPRVGGVMSWRLQSLFPGIFLLLLSICIIVNLITKHSDPSLPSFSLSHPPKSSFKKFNWNVCTSVLLLNELATTNLECPSKCFSKSAPLATCSHITQNSGLGVWCPDQQYQNHLGSCLKCKFTNLTKPTERESLEVGPEMGVLTSPLGKLMPKNH